MIIKLKPILFFMVLCILCVGCFPKTFSQSDKILYTTNQTLQSAKEFRVLALQSAAEYYKKGLLPENKKIEIIDLGDRLQGSINNVADALIIYQQLGPIGKEDVKFQMQIFTKLFEEFTNLVAPFN